MQLEDTRDNRVPQRQGLCLFVLCLVVYLCNGRAQPEVDCLTPPYTAWSVVRHGSLDLRPYPDVFQTHLDVEVIKLKDGSWLSFRPVGVALSMVPIVAPVAMFRSEPLSANGMAQLGKIGCSLYVAAAAVIFFYVVRRYAANVAFLATILFALGTSLWSVASQASWPHAPATFAMCLGLSLLLPGPGRDVGVWRGALAGLVLGCAVTARPTTALFLPATALVLLTSGRLRLLTTFTLTGAVPVIALMIFQGTYLGHPLLGSYARVSWEGRPPLWYGLAGLLVSPSRGLLIYSPALILAVSGVWAVCRLQGWTRQLLLSWCLAFTVTLLYYARWPSWYGGWCYGPRFFCEMLPLLCLLTALGIAGWSVRVRQLVAGGLITVSLFIHGVGVFGHSANADWHTRHLRTPLAEDLFEIRDSQIEAHTRAIAAKWR